MAFQFAHISTFSRKGNGVGRNVNDIAGEAARLEGQAPHVSQPVPPTLLAGIDPAEVPAEIETRIRLAKAALRGSGTAAIRKDTHVLEGMVMSHPAYCSSGPDGLPSLEDPGVFAAYVAWRADTVTWAIEDARRRGLEVLSVVEHLDEQHPHVHVLSVPTNRRIDAKISHPGQAAKAAILSAGGSPAEANRAYKAAMRAWQDEYHQAVGARHALTRVGPSRRRLTRAQWQIEKAEAARVAQTLAEAAVAEKAAALKLAAANQKELEVAAKAAAVEAWSDGLLVGPDEECQQSEKLLSFRSAAEAQEAGLVAKLSPAWPWIHEWTSKANASIERRIDDQVSKRVAAALAALVISAKAWAAGLLRGRGQGQNTEGEPTLVVNAERKDEGRQLVEKLKGHRHLAAELLDHLPDLAEIRQVARRAAELAPFLDRAEQSKAQAMSTQARNIERANKRDCNRLNRTRQEDR